MPSPTSPTLLTLPTELKLQIATHLRAPEVVLLRLTCTHLYHLLPPPLTESSITEIERSLYNHRHLSSCPECLKFYPDERWETLQGDTRRERVFSCPDCGSIRQLRTGSEAWYYVADDDEEYAKIKALRRKQGLGRAFWEARRLLPVILDTDLAYA